MNNFLKSIYNSYLYKSVTKTLSGVNLVPILNIEFLLLNRL